MSDEMGKWEEGTEAAPDETLVVPEAEEAPGADGPESEGPEGGGAQGPDDGRGGRRLRLAVAAGLGLAVVALAVGLATCQPSGGTQAAGPAAQGQQGDARGEDSLEDAAREAAGELAFAGEDVSVADAGSIEVEVVGDDVWVRERSGAGAAERVSGAAQIGRAHV